MARPTTKESTARTFRLQNEIGQRLDEYSEKSRIPRTAIVEMALEEYLNKVLPQKAKKKAGDK